MWFTKIEIQNINSYQDTSIDLSKQINLLVGPNNSGKSTILNLIVLLQHLGLTNISKRVGKPYGSAAFHFHLDESSDIIIDKRPLTQYLNVINVRFDSNVKRNLLLHEHGNTRDVSFNGFDENEPKNILYPYLSKRKVVSFNEEINSGAANKVTGNLTYLYAKIDRLSTRGETGHEEFFETCRKIFGFEITVKNSERGKIAGYRTKSDFIELTKMGEGLVNLLGLIVDLCIAEDKIFLIEELENDVHPKILKKVMDLIIKKSINNQFFISTHSNILLRYLGGVDTTKVFKVKMDIDEKTSIPLSSITELKNDTRERLSLLEDLGYDFEDNELWKGWLFLEESSAELIIRAYLIPWFAPKLNGKIRTFSSNGVGSIRKKIREFHDLFVFLHLEPAYKNKAWVVIDAGVNEKIELDKIKKDFVGQGWDDSHFLQLNKHDFEEYYPSFFSDEIEKTKALTSEQKRNAKKLLLEKVVNWLDNPINNPKEALSESASEIINILLEIEKNLV